MIKMSEIKSKKPRKEKRKYKVSPLWVMKKQIIHEHLSVRGNEIYCTQFVFTPDRFPCGECGDSDHIVFSRQSPLNKVVKSCKYCGVTEIIETEDTQTGAFFPTQLGESVIVSAAEIKAFIKRNHMKKKFLHPTIKRVLERKIKRAVDISKLELELEE